LDVGESRQQPGVGSDEHFRRPALLHKLKPSATPKEAGHASICLRGRMEEFDMAFDGAYSGCWNT
jgi:hypothetical protein